MYAVADAVISVLSLATLAYVIYSTKGAFGKHHFNIFSYLMLILIVFSLISKSLTLPTYKVFLLLVLYNSSSS